MKYIFTGLALLLSPYLFAQDFVKGVVLTEDAKGRIKPLPFANVYWMGTNAGVSADSNGVFQLDLNGSLNPIVSSFVGFKSDTQIVSDPDLLITFVLRDNTMLKEVEIGAKQSGRTLNLMKPMKWEEMDEKELMKAACCNLSESFETNPTVDVNFTDAVTGSRQIRMLGLSGNYVMISRENMPGIRGLNTSFGLSYIPGTWISSIQVAKGVGSVANGYESMTGQINFELKKPDEGERTDFNLFLNQSGRTELNLVHTQDVGSKWSTTLLLHGNVRPIEQDMNKDGFRDFPLQEQINVMNRWKFVGNNGLRMQLGFHYYNDKREGGQTDEAFESKESPPFEPYRIDIENDNLELFAKIGYVFPQLKYKSTGLQLSLVGFSELADYGETTYIGGQTTFYANWIYQSIIGNSSHKFKTGLSYMNERYYEDLLFRIPNNEFNTYERTESVPGVFFEYSYIPNSNISLVAGIRADEHNIYGTLINPRLHFRWALDEFSALRLMGGSGNRTANPIAERQSLLATSRVWQFLGTSNLPYGLEQERSWNVGLNYTRNFKLDYREGFFSVDLYRTEFTNQMVVDLDESSSEALFYNLEGRSFANNLQLELEYEIIKFVDLRMAYRFTEVMTQLRSGLRQAPLTPKHRYFVNLGYSGRKNLKEANWMFDATLQLIGEQRIPFTADKSSLNQRSTTAPSFTLLNAQITRNFNSRWAVYLGVDNILNYRQDNPIIDSDNPFSPEFDASLVWGPIFGRMVHGGVRLTLNEKNKKKGE